jgi:hypothetical protein
MEHGFTAMFGIATSAGARTRAPTSRCHAAKEKNMDEKKKSSMVDQMMAAMARKNAQHYPETKNADGTVKVTKPRRGTGPVPRPMKKVTGRGR